MTLPEFIFSVDAESDGLNGPTYAIGAVVMKWSGEVEAEFGGMSDAESVRDDFSRTHVIPQLNGLPDYESRGALRNAFWEFWMRYRDRSLAVSYIGIPVEARLFNECVHDDMQNREFQGPYPLHELATLFLLHGYDPTETDTKQVSGEHNLRDHNPVDDARAVAECVILLQPGSGSNNT